MQGGRSALKTLSSAGERAVARALEPDPAEVDPDRMSTREDDTLAPQTPEPRATAEPAEMGEPSPLASPAASEAANSQPAVLIDIDPSGPGGVVHDRFDVLIRGRALSPASLEEVSLRAGDRTVATASFGEPERATDGTMPDGTPARQRGFQFNLPLQHGGKPELFKFQIVARTVDGFDYVEAFGIELDPTALPPLSVVTGPTRSSDLGSVRPHTMMHIERGAMDNEGVLAVEGWALSLGAISAMQLFIGRQRIAAARLGGDREDVAAAYGEYPNAELSGFSLTLKVEEEDRQAATIRARLICADGFAHEEAIPIERIDQRSGSWLASPTAEVQASTSGVAAVNRTPRLEAPNDIRMFCDGAELSNDGHLCVSGWAVCAAGTAQVRVFLDETVIGLAVLGYERADVGAVYASIPMARWSGFRFERRLGRRFEGEHIVRVVVRDTRASKKDESVLVLAMADTEVAPVEALATGTQAAPASALATISDAAAEFLFALESRRLPTVRRSIRSPTALRSKVGCFLVPGSPASRSFSTVNFWVRHIAIWHVRTLEQHFRNGRTRDAAAMRSIVHRSVCATATTRSR